MLRRALALALLLVGLLLIAQIVRHPALDSFRTLAVAGVVVGGIVFNVVSLICRHLSVRPGFRVLAVAVGGLLLIGVLAARHHMGVSAVPSVPQSDVALRATLLAWRSTLLYLGIGLGYLVLSIAVLPWPESPKRVVNPAAPDNAVSDYGDGAAGGL